MLVFKCKECGYIATIGSSDKLKPCENCGRNNWNSPTRPNNTDHTKIPQVVVKKNTVADTFSSFFKFMIIIGSIIAGLCFAVVLFLAFFIIILGVACSAL